MADSEINKLLAEIIFEESRGGQIKVRYKAIKLIKATNFSRKTFLKSADDVESYMAQFRPELLAAIRAGPKTGV